MKQFELVKTVSYDLSATITVEDNMKSEDVIDLIEREGDSWIDWEQSDGNDESLTVFEIEEETNG